MTNGSDARKRLPTPAECSIFDPCNPQQIRASQLLFSASQYSLSQNLYPFIISIIVIVIVVVVVIIIITTIIIIIISSSTTTVIIIVIVFILLIIITTTTATITITTTIMIIITSSSSNVVVILNSMSQPNEKYKHITIALAGSNCNPHAVSPNPRGGLLTAKMHSGNSKLKSHICIIGV
jgi:hypothetical protein